MSKYKHLVAKYLFEFWYMFRFFYFIFVCLPLFASCFTKRMAVQIALSIIEVQYQSMSEEADLRFAEQSIPSNLKMMEGFLRIDEANIDRYRCV